MPSLSVCMMVQNSEQTLAIALESLTNVYDELIIVDGGSTDSTCDIALSYGAKIIHSKWTGNHSHQRNIYLNELKTEWFFTIDSDEFIDSNLRDFLVNFKKGDIYLDSDNCQILRRWLSPISNQNYLSSKPYIYDWQTRLFKVNRHLVYQGLIHEEFQGLCFPPLQLVGVYIYHLDLYINNIEKRREKIARYIRKYLAEINYPHYLLKANYLYLPNFKDIEIEKINSTQLLSIVRQLLDKLLPVSQLSSNLFQTYKINQYLSEKLKKDRFYMAVNKFAILQKIQTVLEIGVFSEELVNEAFKRAMPQKPNQLKSLKLNDLSLLRLEAIKHEIRVFKHRNEIDIIDLLIINNNTLIQSFDLEEINNICKPKIILLSGFQEINEKQYLRLLASEEYMLIEHEIFSENKWAIFQNRHYCNKVQLSEYISELNIQFFTIVLNGEPFVRYHIEVFKQLPFKWHWHIVEGVAELKHDTAWSLQLGGRIAGEFHHNGRSYDGTTEYLDELARQYPENITIYRKPEGVFWDGKREMVNAPLSNVHEECLLWQIDVDELWTVEQICTSRQIFIHNPEKTAAYYWCWYFVGADSIVSTRNCYSQNPQQEWLRTWRYKPGAVWVAHEPPRLAEPLPNGQWRDIASVNPFTHNETENLGLVFQHFAYVTPEQLKFKEQYYGYKNAVSQWQKLQLQTQFPLLLRQFFSWVGDTTQVDRASSYGVVPIAQKNIRGDWCFLQLEELYAEKLNRQQIEKQRLAPTIIVDGVFFQLYKTGIARVWRSLLEEWVKSGFAQHIIVLDRASTAPAIAGIKYRSVPAYDYSNTDADRAMLQQVCDEENADLFISSYYTTPLSTPSVFLAHDMIPELMGANLNHPMWREKHYGIQHATAYIAVSEHTAHDLVKFFPDISLESVTVAQNGVDRQIFSPANSDKIDWFKMKYGISKPYFLIVGAGAGYKNSILFFQAFAQLHSKQGFDIVCTGSGYVSDVDFRTYTSGSTVHMLQLSDEELSIAYSGAVALVYPSKYEGFGLPVLEAIACGCPVITCANGAIPEVVGEAAIYVNDEDVDGLVNALCEVQKPIVRNSLSFAGLQQAQKFSWSKMAEKISSTLIKATLLPLNLRETNYIIFPDWSQSEEIISEDLEQVIRAIATHPNSNKITLLVDKGNLDEEEVSLILSGVSMNLLMQEDLDISESAEISLIGQLSEVQWQALLPRIQARIVMKNENREAIAQVKAENMPSWELD